MKICLGNILIGISWYKIVIIIYAVRRSWLLRREPASCTWASIFGSQKPRFVGMLCIKRSYKRGTVNSAWIIYIRRCQRCNDSRGTRYDNHRKTTVLLCYAMRVENQENAYDSDGNYMSRYEVHRNRVSGTRECGSPRESSSSFLEGPLQLELRN